jgi:hypothetical protein
MTSKPTALFAIAGCAMLAACSTATPYQQATGPQDDGYRSTEVDRDTYRVVFEGNETTSRQTVETYLLYRAAQIAQNTGHDYFRVRSADINANIDLETYNTYTSAPGYYGYGVGYTGFQYPYYTASPYTVGYRGFANQGSAMVDVDDSYRAVAYIEMFEERPANRSNLFETSDVIAELRSRIERPEGEDLTSF